jgi:phosphoribosyl-ATP pyrophosphohydrolase/phosphoribosyl-AMP cyclohydrolase
MTTRDTPIAGAADLEALDFTKGAGVVTVVAQDAATRRVLMVAQADREALERSLAGGEMHYLSRRRGLWHKGAQSGNVQRLVSLHSDCDGDALLAMVEPAGPSCHTGSTSCFRSADAAGSQDVLDDLDATIAARAAETSAESSSHTRRLLADRNLRLKKLGEEATELAVACADGDRDRAIAEAADLLYHTLVALHACNAGLADVKLELSRRKHESHASPS